MGECPVAVFQGGQRTSVLDCGYVRFPFRPGRPFTHMFFNL